MPTEQRTRVAGLALLAAIAALDLCPTRSDAQTAPANTQTAAANPDADLFLPSLQGGPNNPSRFIPRGNTVTADQALPALLPAPP